MCDDNDDDDDYDGLGWAKLAGVVAGWLLDKGEFPARNFHMSARHQ